jgi:hypothetical protein
MKITSLSILFFLLSCQILIAQDTVSSVSNLRIIAKHKGSEVLLRWAPLNPVWWKLGNKYGYTLQRTTLNKDGIADELGYKNYSHTLTVWSHDKWKPFIPNDEYMTVAGGIIFDSIQSEPIPADQPYLVNNIDLNNRYSFALFAADMSKNAASASALGFIDKAVDTNHIYQYRIFFNDSLPGLPSDTAYTVVQFNKGALHQHPDIDHYVSNDSTITLYWDRLLYRNYFTAYNIERMEKGGKKWIKLNHKPYIYSPIAAESDTPFNIFTDTNVLQGVDYIYRINGISPFGEETDFSDTLSARCIFTSKPPVASSLSIKWISNTQLELSWSLDDPNNRIVGMVIARSFDDKDGFEPLHTKLLSHDTHTFIDNDVPETYDAYYKVYTFDKRGNYNESFVAFTERNDSIPPSTPLGLTGDWSSSGDVTLSWNLGKEKDLSGYKIYYANDSSHYFALLANNLIKDTVFQRKFNEEVLTKYIYFKVQAVDMRYNVSPQSHFIKVKRPDKIPPMPAEFFPVVQQDSTAFISWTRSKSTDVAGYKIYKKYLNEQFQFILDTKNPNITSFIDKKLKYNDEVSYRVVTYDDSKNETLCENDIFFKLNKIYYLLKPLKVTYNKSPDNNEVKLMWESPKNASRIDIYKLDLKGNVKESYAVRNKNEWIGKLSEGNNKFSLKYITLQSEQSEFTFVEVKK